MGKIAGVDVLVWVQKGVDEYIAIGGQSGASLELSSDVIDITDKNSGGWRSSMAGMLSWSLSADGFLVEDDEALEILETKFLAREFIEMEVKFPSGKLYKGTASISSFPLDLSQDSAVSYSLQFDGVGPLEITPAPPLVPTALKAEANTAAVNTKKA